MQISHRDIDRYLIAIGVAKKLLDILENSKSLKDAKTKIEKYLSDKIVQLQDLVEEIAP